MRGARFNPFGGACGAEAREAPCVAHGRELPGTLCRLLPNQD